MIKLEGAGLERFVNRALEAGLSIWNVQRTGRNTMTANVSVGSFYALRKLNRNLGCRIHILEKHGLPIALSRLWFRKVLALGWIAVLAALLLSSRYVWFFRFEGCDQVTPAQLMATLEEMGIRAGTPRGQVITSQLGKAVMATDPRIAWAGAELKGVVLQLSIQEAGQEPTVLEEGPPQSIYAARDGVIRRIVPLQGKALFQAGDAVLKGQKLITGELGEDLAVQARGEVIARVLYRFSYTAPYAQVAPCRTGETYTYTIVGVYEYKQNAMMSAISTASDKDISTELYVPLNTVKRITGTMLGRYQFATIASLGQDSQAVASLIQDFLNRYYANNQDFQVGVLAMETMTDMVSSTMDTLSIAISVIAGISLLVGGIGVMNIMLVSVTERTREIGTRKALGATNGNIRTQFVVESVIICLVGGLIGILVGAALGYLGSSLLEAPSGPTLGSILLAFGFSMAIGVFFGYYPANKAANLDPIEALRYE